MTRFSLLLAGTATLIAATAAEARDGCGQGWFHNGVACARQEGPSYGRRYGGYDGGYYGGGYQRPRPEGSWRAPNFGGNVVRPTRGNNGAMSCSNAGYTWQNGACRPYRGG
jgi:hypothetical protein